MTDQTILIVHTENSSRRRHFAAARRYPARLILLKHNPTWERDAVDAVLDVDTRSIERTVDAVLALRTREPIDGVVTFVEHSVPTAAAIAAALGLPFVSERTARLARNKYEMRCAFAAKGIPCPKFELARTLQEARRIGTAFGYPLVLKPLIGGGSMYIRRVDSDLELEQHFHLIQEGAWNGFDYDPLHASAQRDYQNAILIESYVDGGEVSIESIVSRGRTTTLAIHDKPLPMCGPFFEEVYFTTPSRLPAEMQRDLRDLTSLSHEALGIDIGATHAEFRTSPTGPIILETAARMGGGPVYRSVLASTGIDMVHAVMDLSLGIEPSLTMADPKPTGFYLFFAHKEGTLQAVHGCDAAAANADVLEIEVYKRVGDRLELPPKVFQAHGHMLVRAETLPALDGKVHDIARQVSFDVAAAEEVF